MALINMKATTYTRGPWAIQGNGTLNHPVTNRPLTTVRFETSLGTFEVLDETNEPDANARLIAAAPDLLAALENILASTCGDVGDDGYSGCIRLEAKALGIAHKAVTKATA